MPDDKPTQHAGDIGVAATGSYLLTYTQIYPHTQTPTQHADDERGEAERCGIAHVPPAAAQRPEADLHLLVFGIWCLWLAGGKVV